MNFSLRKSLTLKIVLRISILVIIISVAMTATSILMFRHNQLDQVTADIQRTNFYAKDLIESEINSYIKQVEAVAVDDKVISMDWDVQKSFLQSEAKRIGFKCFQVGDLYGKVKTTDGEELDYGDQRFYRAAVGGKSGISDLIYHAGYDKMVVFISVPICTKSGVEKGILSGVADPEFLNDIINSIQLTYDGYNFAINAGGWKMAGVDYKGKHELENDLYNKDSAPGGKLYSSACVQKDMIQGESEVEEFVFDGIDYFISYTPVMNGQWFLGTVQVKKQALSQMKLMLERLINLCIVFVAMGIASGVLLSKSLHPLKSVSTSINTIASGKADLTQRIKQETEDEIGSVVEGFNKFTEKLQDIIRVLKQSKNELQDVGNNLNQQTENTVNSVNEILECIRSVGNSIQGQNTSVEETAHAVNEITQNIDSLQKMIDSQAMSVSQASSAVEEMIGNIASVNNTMEKMAESFVRLEQKTKNGAVKQDDVSARIDVISQESVMLRGANKTIQNIAYQTNLLAMNAAIEAAHAGAAGRGFSVVADEIRKLSETSSAQTKTIGEQLKNIEETIQGIILASQESKVAFNEVSNGIKETDELVHQVTQAMREQTVGSSQINDSLHEMNDSTTEVKTAVFQMTKESESILGEVKSLEEATAALKQEMHEMEEGAKLINKTSDALSGISKAMDSSISDIGLQVDQFEV